MKYFGRAEWIILTALASVVAIAVVTVLGIF